MKTIIKIAVPVFLILTILFIGYSAYKDAIKKTADILTIIPVNASVIIKINDLENTIEELENTVIWKKILSIDKNNIIDKEINHIHKNIIEKKEVYNMENFFISIHKTGLSNNAILFSTILNKEYLNNQAEIIQNFGLDINKRKYDGRDIYIINDQENKTYYFLKNEVLFFSKSMLIIEDVIKSINTEENLLTNNDFHTTYKTINTNADINLFINYNRFIKTINSYTKNKIKIKDFSYWCSSDIEIKDDILISNGFTNLKNKTKNYTDIFYKQQPVNIEISNIIPENTASLLAIGYSKSQDILNNKNKILQKNNKFWGWDKKRKALNDSTGIDYNILIQHLEKEAGFFSINNTMNNSKYTYFKTKNSIITASFIQKLIQENYRYNGHNINYSYNKNFTGHLFGELFNNEAPYFTIINDYFIFGKSKSAIEYIIDNYNNRNTLSNSNHYQKFSSLLSSKSNLLLYINPGKILSSLKLDKKHLKNIDLNIDSLLKFTGASIQISNKKNLLSNNITILYDKEYKKSIEEEWFIQLDTTIAIRPQFVQNHFTKEKMILVQTHSHNLYALDSKGNIIWEKQMKEKIIGDISTIDMYSNNKYQALFNTRDKLHIIDRNGKHVDGFPKKLPYETNIGHSLFDYNNKKKYRIMIVGVNNNIYNLTKNGNKVSGWKYKKQQNKIISPLRHFKHQTKDYILEETKEKSIRLLAINGSERTLMKIENNHNNSSIQISKQGKLYNITKDGKIWKGTLDGNSTETLFTEINPESILIIHKDTQLVFHNKDKLFSINDKFDILYSISFKEEILNISNHGEYILIKTKNNIYLCKDEEIIDGFPINSDGLYNISDINNNDKVNLINVKNGSLYNYELFD